MSEITMSAPVATITDDLIAELERECRQGSDDHGGMGHDEESELFDRIGNALRALLAERAELKRDAERYRFIRKRSACDGEMTNGICIDLWENGYGSELNDESADHAIDAAMAESSQP